LISNDYIFIEKADFESFKCFLTLRIRGAEKILKASGPVKMIYFMFSQFTDISDAEFNFNRLLLENE
jgi:hypothetical protein